MYLEPTDCTSLFATQSSDRSNNLDDLVTDFLVKELDVGKLLGFANRIPKVDQLFSAAGECELTSVLRLLLLHFLLQKLLPLEPVLPELVLEEVAQLVAVGLPLELVVIH